MTSRIIIQLLLIWVYVFLQKAPRPCCQSKLIISFILVKNSFVVVGVVLNKISLRETSGVTSFPILPVTDGGFLGADGIGSRQWKEIPLVFIAQLSPLSSPAVFTEGQTDWPRAEIHLLLFSLCGFFFFSSGAEGVAEWKGGQCRPLCCSFWLCCSFAWSLCLFFVFFSNSEPFPISKTFCFLYDWKLRMISPVVWKVLPHPPSYFDFKGHKCTLNVYY